MSHEPTMTMRGLRFGLVGLSGVLVNQGMLWFGQEFLYARIANVDTRLDCALISAIGLATVNNYYWNQRWTWADRVPSRTLPALLKRFMGYVSASVVAIVVQFALTKFLVGQAMHYAVANLAAIALAAGINFGLNHTLTFARQSSKASTP
jgi:dolichol-phosphate mannosyltransferase